MQGTNLALTYYISGTLAANQTIVWKAPFACHVTHIQACGSNANDGLLTVGISSDTDSILTSSSIGDSASPATFTRTSWATTNPTGALAAGDILTAVLDYDGASGTATQNFMLAITLTEG